MAKTASNIISIKNNTAAVSVDTLGGAIVDFHLHANGINTLNFKFPDERMPENNKPGAAYQGHFACIGRWGEPSAGEIRAGLANHGQAANLPWTIEPGTNEHTIYMNVNTPLEGLYVSRVLKIDADNPVFMVTERVRNINPLGRLYNIVQHPTITAPFLDKHTVINSNASTGFSCFGDDGFQRISEFPEGICDDGTTINLANPDKPYNSVFAFVVDKEDAVGWLTAWSPTHNMLFGYVWKRVDYPWIGVWQDFAGGEIKIRGLEFGTTGIHRPFDEILAAKNINVLGEDTVHHIDADEEVERSYCSFLYPVENDFKGVEQISTDNGNIIIKPVHGKQLITLSTNFKF